MHHALADADFFKAAGPRKPILCLDVSLKNIGLATGVYEIGIATALQVIRRRKFTQDAETLLQIAKEREVASLLIGLPFNMDGSEGRRAQSVRSFARNLAPLTDLPIALWDERLSTAQAEEDLEDQGSRRAKQADLIDAAAARVILQSAFDALRP